MLAKKKVNKNSEVFYRRLPSFILIFIVQHAVAITFIVRVCDLLAEFRANALIFFRMFQAAGAVAAGALEALANCLHYLFIFI